MTVLEVVWLGVGVALFVAGFAALAMARRLEASGSVWPVVGRVSRATETTLGVALVFAGYHVAAYGGPAGWISFRVPPDLGWLVFAACGLAIVGALVTDRVLDEPGEGSGSEGEGG